MERKIEIIKYSLENNPKVEIVNCLKNSSFVMGYEPNIYIDYLICPKEGLYKVDELQDFMMDLIPSHPDKMEPFFKWKKRMYLGAIFFEECVGKEENIKKIKLDYKDKLSSYFVEKIEKERIQEKNVFLRTGIYVFPDKKELEEKDKKMLEEKGDLWFYYGRPEWRHILLKELRKDQPKKGFLEKILGK